MCEREEKREERREERRRKRKEKREEGERGGGVKVRIGVGVEDDNGYLGQEKECYHIIVPDDSILR